MARLLDNGSMALLEGSSFLNPHDYHVDMKPLAKGSAATIYLGHRSQCDRGDDTTGVEQPHEIALKVLTPPASAVEHLALLNKEVTVFAAVQGHPNILGFYGVCLMEQTFNGKTSWAIQMEACAEDLHDFVTRSRFPEAEACGVMTGILEGLGHMHELGFVHRDMKPENVLITRDGIVKVADFGISCRISDKEAMKKRCGSPGFAAPELLMGQEYGVKVDTFSCGAVLHVIISGRKPFSGDTVNAVMKKTIESPVNFRKSVLLERLSEDCKEFMKALLNKEPTYRPTAREALGMISWLKESDQNVVQGDVHWSFDSECSLDSKISASTMGCGSSRQTSCGESGRTTFSDAMASDRETNERPTPQVSCCANHEEHMDQIAEQESVIFSDDGFKSPLLRRRMLRSCKGNIQERQPTAPTTRRPSNGIVFPRRPEEDGSDSTQSTSSVHRDNLELAQEGAVAAASIAEA